MFLLVETRVSTQWLRPSDVEGRHCWWRGSKSCVVRRNGQKHGPTKLLSTWSRWCIYVLVECSRSKKSWRWKCWYTGRCCCNCFLFFLQFRRVLRSIHVRTILWLEMGHRNATLPLPSWKHATQRIENRNLSCWICAQILLKKQAEDPRAFDWREGWGVVPRWRVQLVAPGLQAVGIIPTKICQTFPFHNCLLKMHTQDEDFYWYTKFDSLGEWFVRWQKASGR